MLFNSAAFAILFIVVIPLYYLLPQVYRWILLLVASIVFYAYYKLSFLYIILVIIIIDYLCAIAIEKSRKAILKKLFLAISLVSNLGILCYYKYFDFLITNLAALPFLHINHADSFAEIILPVGLSFHTFQSLGYTIDVSKGEIKAEKHFGYFACFVLFFPQMVAGPIEGYATLGKELKQQHPFSYENISKGLRLILYGLFAKVAVADSVSIPVDQFYTKPEAYNSYSSWIAVLLFSIQIYADFLGYSTMAVGIARCMGIKLMDNFRSPYFALNLVDFWRKWHISLTSWFRKYVYIPLGGNRVSTWRWILNILLVFSLSGLWHGASWNFVWWGVAHGILYLIELPLDKLSVKNRIAGVLLILSNFILVSLLWIFFRGIEMQKVWQVFANVFSFSGEGEMLEVPIKIPVLIALFFIMETAIQIKGIDSILSSRYLAVRWTIYTILLFFIMLYSEMKTAPFIYFQF